MDHYEIFRPLFAQILLTFFIWGWLLWGRVSKLFQAKINPQRTADEVQSKVIFKEYENQSDNLENLFELPVLFYVAVLLIAFSGITDSLYVSAGWAYVLTRTAHSIIHCSYNRIVHRFYAYIISCFILWFIWIRIAVHFL